jgi:prepilin-type N-terminal cleavage/methylation domain-containing protein
MVRRFPRRSRGYTLVEAMIVVSILGILVAMGTGLFLRMYQFFNQMDARTDVQRELRVALDNINHSVRQASAATIYVDEATNQPPYSQISFITVDGSTVSYSQIGNSLVQSVNRNKTVLTQNLQYIAFSYPQTDINTVLSISMTLQKKTYSGRSTALQMAISKVRVMNP